MQRFIFTTKSGEDPACHGILWSAYPKSPNKELLAKDIAGVIAEYAAR